MTNRARNIAVMGSVVVAAVLAVLWAVNRPVDPPLADGTLLSQLRTTRHAAAQASDDVASTTGSDASEAVVDIAVLNTVPVGRRARFLPVLFKEDGGRLHSRLRDYALQMRSGANVDTAEDARTAESFGLTSVAETLRSFGAAPTADGLAAARRAVTATRRRLVAEGVLSGRGNVFGESTMVRGGL